MSIRDRNINWRRRLYRIPWQDFHRTTGTDVSMLDATTLPVEVSTFGVGGLTVAASTTFNIAAIDMRLLTEMDFASEVGFRVLTVKTASTTSTDDVTFVLTYEVFGPGYLMSAIETALDTPLGQHANLSTTQYKIYRGPRGIMAANTLTDRNHDDLLGLALAVSASSFDAGELVFLGLEVDYLPLLCSTATLPRDYSKDLGVTP
jgi:hypothetical protein